MLLEGCCRELAGYDEDSNVIFLWTAIGVFMIQLESMKFAKVSDDTPVSMAIFPSQVSILPVIAHLCFSHCTSN
jgi:hypothetical protein